MSVDVIDPVGLGVVGLGRAFMLMLPTFLQDERVRLAGAATNSQKKRQAFEKQFSASAVPTLADLCANPEIEAIYVATPHEVHRENVVAALQANKHVLVEKPMTIESADARAIVEAEDKSSRKVIVGPSHSFDKPIIETGRLIASGKYGRVGMIHAHYYTDFVFRPRRPEELDAAHGGGAVFNQGAHHADVLLTLAGSSPTSVFGRVADLDSRRPCDGAYSAIIDFENGCIGSITYSGYGHYDSDADMEWISEIGILKVPDEYAMARKRLLRVENEVAAKASRGFVDEIRHLDEPDFHEHFGKIIVSCEKADICPTSKGIHIYGDEGHEFVEMPLTDSPREEVIAELYALVREGLAPVHSARRGLVNVMVCEGIYESSRNKRRVELAREIH